MHDRRCEQSTTTRCRCDCAGGQHGIHPDNHTPSTLPRETPTMRDTLDEIERFGRTLGMVRDSRQRTFGEAG